MTAINMCSNFGGFRLPPPLIVEYQEFVVYILLFTFASSPHTPNPHVVSSPDTMRISFICLPSLIHPPPPHSPHSRESQVNDQVLFSNTIQREKGTLAFLDGREGGINGRLVNLNSHPQIQALLEFVCHLIWTQEMCHVKTFIFHQQQQTTPNNKHSQ